jgi:sporulation protein YabP
MVTEVRKPAKPHILTLNNRSSLTVSGVIRVDNFNESVITLITGLGRLTVEGERLHINKLILESGDMHIDGEIAGMYYTNDTPSAKTGGVFGRLFK